MPIARRVRRGLAGLVCAIGALAPACAGKPAGGHPDAFEDPGGTGSGGGTNGGPCNVVITHETPLARASHVDQGTVVDWASNPPSSGAHYPTHAAWATTFPIVVERGNYLHNEEHGGVVLLYNCTDCQDTIDGLTAIGQALPQDPRCTPPITARWLVTRDPLLPDGITVAAAAWGWTLVATCVDAARIAAFVDARYSNGGADRLNCGGAVTP